MLQLSGDASSVGQPALADREFKNCQHWTALTRLGFFFFNCQALTLFSFLVLKRLGDDSSVGQPAQVDREFKNCLHWTALTRQGPLKLSDL